MGTNTRYTIAGVVLLLLAMGLLYGCGQKGPLYLPDESRQYQQRK